MKSEPTEIKLLQLLRRLRDPRMPHYGGYEYNGRGFGMGRYLLGLTVYGQKKNGRVVLSNGAY